MLTFTATISLLLAPPPPPENYFLIVLPVPHAKLTPACPQKIRLPQKIGWPKFRQEGDDFSKFRPFRFRGPGPLA